MRGKLTNGFPLSWCRENVPGFPCAYAICNFMYLMKAHGTHLVVCSYLFSDGTPINTSDSVVCQSQSGEIHCPNGSFLYVDRAIYGYNRNTTQQETTEECSLSFNSYICYEEITDFGPFTTAESITNIQVPHRNVTCANGREVPINYALIHHMCIPGMDIGYVM